MRAAVRHAYSAACHLLQALPRAGSYKHPQRASSYIVAGFSPLGRGHMRGADKPGMARACTPGNLGSIPGGCSSPAALWLRSVGLMVRSYIRMFVNMTYGADSMIISMRALDGTARRRACLSMRRARGTIPMQMECVSCSGAAFSCGLGQFVNLASDDDACSTSIAWLLDSLFEGLSYPEVVDVVPNPGTPVRLKHGEPEGETADGVIEMGDGYAFVPI